MRTTLKLDRAATCEATAYENWWCVHEFSPFAQGSSTNNTRQSVVWSRSNNRRVIYTNLTDPACYGREHDDFCISVHCPSHLAKTIPLFSRYGTQELRYEPVLRHCRAPLLSPLNMALQNL